MWRLAGFIILECNIFLGIIGVYKVICNLLNYLFCSIFYDDDFYLSHHGPVTGGAGSSEHDDAQAGADRGRAVEGRGGRRP